MKTFSFSATAILLIFLAGNLVAQTFTNYTTNEGLPSNFVNGVAIDDANNKWFATSAGVAKFDNVNWTVYTTSNGVIDDYINCIATDPSNNVWIGTDAGISKFDGTNWTSYTTANGLINNIVTYIASDINGTLWFGTNSGLSRLNGTTWTNFTTTNGLPNNLISYIKCDSLHNAWIGTWIGGLAKYDGTAFTVMTNADSIPDNNVITIAIDHSYNKWVGTFSGMARLDQNNSWVKNYRQTDGLYNNYIQDIAVDSKNNKWIGIYADYLGDGALTKFDGTNFTSYSTAQGLVSPVVHRVAVDNQDIVWIVTANGVSKFKDGNIGMDDLSDQVVPRIFPNPAVDVLYLENLPKAALVSIANIQGQLLIQKSTTDSSASINISMLSPGSYIVTIQFGTRSYYSKLMIQ